MIFNIQRYSTHDGPGVRTVVFLKGCSLSCRWCQNPESESRKQEVLYDERFCIKDCNLCSMKFPQAFQKQEGILKINRDILSYEDYKALKNVCPSTALSVCGEEKSVDEIMQEVQRDEAFYFKTGGGVTLSGGEPFMQPALAAKILARCGQKGYHTAVETCLHTPWKHISPSLPNIRLFLADLKHIDESKFYQWTGGSAKRVLENYRHLSNESNADIIIRVPLIQGFNADRRTVKNLVDFVANETKAKEMHFLPYHTLGVNKYKMLDMPYLAPDKALKDEELLAFAQDYASQRHLTSTLRG